MATNSYVRLVEALGRGLAGAVGLLVDAYGARVYGLALRMTGSKRGAEKVAQDVLWTAVRTIHMFRSESAFETWLDRTAARAAYQTLRRRKPNGHEIVLDDVLPALDGDGRHFAWMEDWSPRVETVSQPALRDVLQAAVDELPPDCRAAFILRDVEGLPSPDIAAALGISPAAARSCVHRARLFLRKRLADYMT